jgi:hypothetical protein
MDTNWAAVFDKLFKEIDGPKGSEFYYSGPDYLEKLRHVKSDTPDYSSLMAHRKADGKSTTRRDYFRDLFYELDELNKLKFAVTVMLDLESRGHPQCEEIRNMMGGGTIAPEITIPAATWNAERLNDFLGKIDVELNLQHPEAVLTLCYTCMEGFFKAYVRKNAPASRENEITALAKIVREDLKQKNQQYPGEVFNIITQTAHALNRIRDGFSESHFGEEAALWVAMYARDLVNTHIRLILHFM